MSPRQVHHLGTLALSLLMAALGVALIVEAIAGRRGSTSLLLVLGVLFVAAGLGRVYAERRRGRGT